MPHILWCTHFKAHGVKFRKTVAMHHSQSWWHGRFNCAWYAYVDLLDIDYSDGFNCIICKHEVDVVICDDTPLSFRRKFLITAPKEETNKKHVKRCKVTPMQKDVYWPQHAGDFCWGTQEVARARKGQLLSNEFDTMLSHGYSSESQLTASHLLRRSKQQMVATFL